MAFGLSDIVVPFKGSDSDIYGSKPVVPGPVDYSSTLEKFIGRNIDMLPSLQRLGELSTEALTAILEKALPGYSTMRDTGTRQITSLLRGELPSDVTEAISRHAAERGIESGTAGSSFANFGELRTLGLTSLNAINQGLSAAERWIAQGRSNTFDFSRMFLGPQDAIRQTEFNWQRDWLAAQVKASPDPVARGEFDSDMAIVGMILSAYGGGAGYTQGYRQNYGGGGGYGGGTGGGYSYFGGPSGYGTVYPGYGGEMYQSVPTGDGGGMSVPYKSGGGTPFL